MKKPGSISRQVRTELIKSETGNYRVIFIFLFFRNQPFEKFPDDQHPVLFPDGFNFPGIKPHAMADRTMINDYVFVPRMVQFLKCYRHIAGRAMQRFQLFPVGWNFSYFIESGLNGFLQPGDLFAIQPYATAGTAIIDIEKILEINYCFIGQFGFTSRAFHLSLICNVLVCPRIVMISIAGIILLCP